MCRKDVTCVPKLVVIGAFTTGMHNIYLDAYLSKWFTPLVGINKHHIFSFQKNNPGVVLMKQTPDDEGLEMNLLKK